MDNEITVPASLLRRILAFLFVVRGWDSYFVDQEKANKLIEEIEEVLNRE